MRYPRNMLGYGRTPPDPKWPGGAYVAVQLVLNYEEGGENNILHGDSASEAFLVDVIGAAPWPNQRHANVESMYEYGARAGFWRLWRYFTAHNLPVTVYGVATALMRAPQQLSAMMEAGWEIASHGYKWVQHKDMPPDEERRQIAEAIRLHTLATGERPPAGTPGARRCRASTSSPRKAASSMSRTPTTTTCPIGGRIRAGPSSSSPIRSRPMICASSPAPASTMARSTSSF